MENITPFVKQFRIKDSDRVLYSNQLIEQPRTYTYRPLHLLGLSAQRLGEETIQEEQFLGEIYYIQAMGLEDILKMFKTNEDKDRHRKRHALVKLRDMGGEKRILLGEIYEYRHDLGIYLPSVIRIQ